jgi:hypothetical protein
VDRRTSKSTAKRSTAFPVRRARLHPMRTLIGCIRNCPLAVDIISHRPSQRSESAPTGTAWCVSPRWRPQPLGPSPEDVGTFAGQVFERRLSSGHDEDKRRQGALD